MVHTFFKKCFKTLNKNVSPSLFNLLFNAKCCRCSIAEIRDKENFIYFHFHRGS